MSERLKKFVAWCGWVLVGIAVAASAYVLINRFRLDAADRQVEIVLDGRGFAAEAQKSGVAYPDLLGQWKQRGATAVAVSEQDLASLQTAGKLKVMTGAEMRRSTLTNSLPAPVIDLVTRGTLVDGYTYVLTQDVGLVDRLGARVGRDRVREVIPGLYEITYPKDRVAQFTLGFDPADFQAVRAAGLRPIPRPANFPLATADAVDGVFAQIDSLAPDARMVIFQGGEVLGYPDALETTAHALQTRKWLLGLVEQPGGNGYIVQKGSPFLVEQLQYRAIRVSNQAEGLSKRRARVLYVRPSAQGEQTVQKAASELAAQGLAPGTPAALPYPRIGRLIQALLSLGVAGALILALGYLGKPRVAVGIGGMVVAVALGVIAWAVSLAFQSTP